MLETMEKPRAQKIPGEVWRSMTREWLWVYRGSPSRSNEWSADILVPPGVFFVERGLVIIRADGREIRVRQGNAFFSAPGLRRQWLAEETVLLSVGYRCAWPDGTPFFRTGLNTSVSFRRIKKLEQATKTLFKAVHGRRKSVAYLEAVQPEARTHPEWCRHEAAYLLWFDAFTESLRSLGIAGERPQSSNEKLLAKVLARLEKCPLDQTNPSPLSSSIGIGPRRLEQLLQERLGMTARAWHERRRLDRARQQLLQEDTPMKEIGYSLGFRHASHFTAWFKRHNGVSPSAFRQSSGQSAA